jgi:hypothetical protein
MENSFNVCDLVIALIGALAGAIFTFIGNLLNNIALVRNKNILTFLKGQAWECEWFDDKNELYVRDKIRMNKHIWFGRLKGLGQIESSFIYPIYFKVTNNEVVTFVYYAEEFPKQKLMGTGCGTFNANGTVLTGGWSGVVDQERFGKPIMAGRFSMSQSK